MIEDHAIMSDLKAHARELKAAHAERDAMNEKYTEMYLLDWRHKASRKLKNMQVTASPDFRNQVQGAVRLMVATDPLINVQETEDTKHIPAGKVEEFLQSVLHHSGRLAGEPVHYPMITAGLLYDEMHAAITPTADMLEHAKKAHDQAQPGAPKAYAKAAVRRMEEIADVTAFLVEPWSPVNGYPEMTSTGLAGYYRAVETTIGEVIDRYGYTEKLATYPRHTKTNLHIFYDPVYTAVWTDQADILLSEHGLARIPVIAQILNGSRMFADPEDQRQPFGYTLLKSGLWNAQNLSLTAIYTAVFNYGVTPSKVYTPAIEGSQIDTDQNADTINLHPGDRLDFVQNKGLIDPALWQASELAGQLGDESTIYPQALGQAVQGGSTFSELNLLSQAGRLPLVGPQRRGGWGISAICETMLAIMREEPRYRNGTGLQASDLPRGIEIETKLDVKLPQDKLQQANIVNILTSPENPKVSTDWALTNILNINDPEEMKRQIWDEQATEQLYRAEVGQLIQAYMQAQIQKAQQPPAGAGGGPQRPPMQPPAGAPVDMEAQAAPGMLPGQADMMEGGLPPQQAGMIPGQGDMVIPPEGA